MRKLDKSGRITIPRWYRKTFHLDKGSLVEITIEKGSINIKPFKWENIQAKEFVGIVRRLDNGGRIVIPSEYLEILKFDVENEYELVIQGEKLIIKKE